MGKVAEQSLLDLLKKLREINGEKDDPSRITSMYLEEGYRYAAVLCLTEQACVDAGLIKKSECEFLGT